MFLIEKMEQALTGFREANIKNSITEHSTVVSVTGTTDAMVQRLSEFKTKLIRTAPFASDSEFIKLDKKVASLSRKVNRLQKQLKELDA